MELTAFLMRLIQALASSIHVQAQLFVDCRISVQTHVFILIQEVNLKTD